MLNKGQEVSTIEGKQTIYELLGRDFIWLAFILKDFNLSLPRLMVL